MGEVGSLAGTEISVFGGEVVEEQSYGGEVEQVQEEQVEEQEEQVEDEAMVVTVSIPVAGFQFCPGCGASLPDLEV